MIRKDPYHEHGRTVFSVKYANRKELFEGLSIWQEEAYRNLRGTYPVISLSFAKVKETSFLNARKKICNVITKLYNRYDFLLDSGKLNGKEKFRSLDEYGLSIEKEEVKKWYDGFCFGGQKDIYNPWSILNYLDKKGWDSIGLTPAPTAWWEN